MLSTYIKTVPGTQLVIINNTLKTQKILDTEIYLAQEGVVGLGLFMSDYF